MSDRELAIKLAAYQHLMETIVTDVQYFAADRTGRSMSDPECVRLYGDIVQRGEARWQEYLQEQAGNLGSAGRSSDVGSVADRPASETR